MVVGYKTPLELGEYVLIIGIKYTVDVRTVFPNSSYDRNVSITGVFTRIHFIMATIGYNNPWRSHLGNICPYKDYYINVALV